MTRAEPPTPPLPEVQIRFEPGRVAPTCLQEAYERLVPVVRRPLVSVQTLLEARPAASPPMAGGLKG